MDIEFDGDFFVFSKQTYGVNEGEWLMQDDVFLYRRLEGKRTFALHQTFAFNDYEEMFGRKLSLSGDLLHIKSANHSYIFSLQNGYFRESFLTDKQYDTFRISGRNAIAAVNGNEYFSLDLSGCTQQTPTQYPSRSPAPSNLPSTSFYPSTIPPTSSQLPSLGPSFSLVPSVSSNPSSNPTTSSAPTFCYNVDVKITTEGNIEGFGDDEAFWELFDNTGEVIKGGAFNPGVTESHAIGCLEPGTYVLKASNTGGNGLGECDQSTCGYFVYADGALLTGSTAFYDGETLHFTLDRPSDMTQEEESDQQW